MRAHFKKLFLLLCWYLGLFHISRYLMRKKLLILCYHGFEISDETAFRPQLFIKKETFDQRLKLINKYKFPVLKLGEALEKLHQHELPQNSIVVTIDDGFYSTKSIAKNSLEKYQYPATLYLTTYYVQKNTPIFRLVVQYMFWKTTKNEIDISECSWWKNDENSSVTKKIRIDNTSEYNDVITTCIRYGEEKCSEQDRKLICEQLGNLLGVNYQEIYESRILSLLSIEESTQLSASGLDIQLHTHRHTFPSDNAELAKKEIIENREVLRTIVNYEPVHFCYPSGLWEKEQWPWLESINVKSATTCLPGLNTSESPALGLTRFLDGENISEIEFKAELFGFMDLIRLLK